MTRFLSISVVFFLAACSGSDITESKDEEISSMVAYEVEGSERMVKTDTVGANSNPSSDVREAPPESLAFAPSQALENNELKETKSKNKNLGVMDLLDALFVISRFF